MNERPQSPNIPQTPAPLVYAPPPPPKSRGLFARMFGGILASVFIFSIVLNVYLVVLVFSMVGGTTHETEYLQGDPNPEYRIVIVPVRGVINDATSSFIHDVFKSLRKNPPAAVILRVDSGGGFVSPSDRIWHELVLFKQETNIPVIASFGSIAASGGYYVAAPSDLIIAEPTCITGSIGVMAQAFTFDRLLDKIGVTPETLVATGSPDKDVANNLARPWTDADRTKLQVVLDHAYEQFVFVVGQGRATHLTEQEVRDLADGRIFTAQAAKALKLIDEVGYLDDAIEQARQLAKLPAGVEPRITEIGVPQSLLSSLTRAQFTDSAAASWDGERLRQMAQQWAVPQILYLWTGK